VSAGFEAKGLGFSAEVSHEVAEQVADSVSESLATSDTHSIQYQPTDQKTGKTLWQFVFKATDSCNYEETIGTRAFAFTEGAFREPCCLPGWAIDAPAYTQCRAGGLISNSSTCSAAVNKYVQLESGSCPVDRQVSKDDCLAAAQAIGADISKMHLDGGRDSGMNGRPQGCTLHNYGHVEWWGPSDNAACGSMNYNCVCKNHYDLLASGSCPVDRQVSKDDCLAAAQAVGADVSKMHLDGGRDSGMNGRPQGCTLHDDGHVEWWGPSNNAACGSMNYNCVCRRTTLPARRLLSTLMSGQVGHNDIIFT
jgi:hypothetical protein